MHLLGEPQAGPPVQTGSGLWMLSRHADVAMALREPRLWTPGQVAADPAAHRAVRAAAEQALPAAQLAAWRDDFAAQAHTLIDALPEATPVDLVSAFAEPWSLAVAQRATSLPRDIATACEPLARRLFLAAAVATDGTQAPDALDTAAQLAQRLSTGAARPGGGLADVQTFVALSQSLPALLAGAWHALLGQPPALAALQASPGDVVRYVGELLRLGSPARAVFRQAGEDLSLASLNLRRGQGVALLLGAANRDPARFADPHRLDPSRDTAGQLGLGAGAHHCAGVALVRLALTVATQALLERCNMLQAQAGDAAAPMAWRGGFATRWPAALPVVWQARQGPRCRTGAAATP